jgi:curli biogenesis system outer membrane secretion channel CsgG
MRYRKLFAAVVLLFSLLLFSCASRPGTPEGGITIAVWDLDDVSPSGGSRTDLGELLSTQVIDALRKKENVTLVERERLVRILEELHLGTTAVVDEATRLKLGRLAGARWMIFGGYQVIADQMRLDLRLVEVETGRVRKAVQKQAAGAGINAWTEAARKAAEDLL